MEIGTDLYSTREMSGIITTGACEVAQYSV